MMLFKLYFQLVKSKWHSFLIYIAVFLAIFMLMLKFTKPTSEMYQAYSYDIAVIDKDQSEASTLLVDYLSKDNQVLMMEEKEQIEDALFLRTISFGIVIEKGFMDEPSLTQLIYDEALGAAGFQGQRIVDNYLNLINDYRTLDPQASYTELHRQAVNALSIKVPVKMLGNVSVLQTFDISSDYFNTLGYVLLALLIEVIGECVVMIFSRSVYIRQLCAPLKPYLAVLSIFFGSLLLGLVIIALMCGIIFYMQPNLWGTLNGYLYLVNALCFCFAVVGLALLVGMISSGHAEISVDKDKVKMFSNVIALTCSFISGFFVPQWLIHPAILKAASLTPAYWYAKVNNLLAEKEILHWSQAKEIFQDQAIVILFGVTFILMAYVLYQNRRQRKTI